MLSYLRESGRGWRQFRVAWPSPPSRKKDKFKGGSPNIWLIRNLIWLRLFHLTSLKVLILCVWHLLDFSVASCWEMTWENWTWYWLRFFRDMLFWVESRFFNAKTWKEAKPLKKWVKRARRRILFRRWVKTSAADVGWIGLMIVQYVVGSSFFLSANLPDMLTVLTPCENLHCNRPSATPQCSGPGFEKIGPA